MNDLNDYYNQKKAIGQRFKQFRGLMGKSKEELKQDAANPLISKDRFYRFEFGAIN